MLHTARPCRALVRSTAALALLLASSACVTQARYDEAIQELQYYQRSYHDLDASVAPLQAELAETKARLASGDATVPAGYTEDIDQRLAELRGIMARLGSRPDQVEVIDIEGGYLLRMQDAILFDSGSDQLLPDGRQLVLDVAERVRAQPFTRLEVRGHTDAVPVRKPETLQRFPHGNIDLSAARAIEVAALLTGEGQVDEAKVVVSGYGPNDPIEPNDSEAGRRRNRRVELYVLD